MKKVFVLVSLAILSIAAFLQGQTKGVTDKVVIFKGESIILYEKSYALLIGVSKYKYWPDLGNIPAELELLGSALEKQGFIISKCLNPNSKELKEAIENFINEHGLKPGNRLLIYFTGHGYTRMKGKKGYIVPADADDPKKNEIGFVQKAIEMEQMVTWAKRIEAKHALFVFDSCFSGAIFQTKTSSVPAYISYLTGKPVRQFITAGSAGETVPSESYFTKCFARGIAGEADEDRDGYITGTELGLYLQKKITGYKIGQTPQVGKIRDPELDQGDFVFIRQVPSAPEPEDIDVSSLKKEAEKIKKEREIRTGWEKWQEKFKENVEKLEQFDKEPDISAASKKQKWQELLKAYSLDNPYSDEDENLRAYIRERISFMDKKVRKEDADKEISKITGDIKKRSEQIHGKEIVVSDKVKLMRALPEIKEWVMAAPDYQKKNLQTGEISNIHTIYIGPGNKRIEVNITDTANASAVLQTWKIIFQMNLKREDDKGFQKITTVNSVTVMEQYDNQSQRSILCFIVKDRYMVELRSHGKDSLYLLKYLIPKFHFSKLD